MDEKITISKNEYDALQYNDAVLHFLIEALISAARLNYAGDGFYFEDSKIDTAMKIMLPVNSAELLTKLLADKEMERGNE